MQTCTKCFERLLQRRIRIASVEAVVSTLLHESSPFQHRIFSVRGDMLFRAVTGRNRRHAAGDRGASHAGGIARNDHRAGRIPRFAFRGRARRRPARRDRIRRPRSPLGAGEFFLYRMETHRQGPGSHLRGHRQRRSLRHAENILGPGQSHQRIPDRSRRRLALRRAGASFHPRCGSRRRAGWGTGGGPRRLDDRGGAQFFNGLVWGPDGWLYGRHGIKKASKVGRPGTPGDERVDLSCGIWRYHPKKRFEVWADGTINPWGLDWNEEGEGFIVTSVIDHLWHLVPGARYRRMPGQGTVSLNPYAYDLMEPTSIIFSSTCCFRPRTSRPTTGSSPSV